VGAPTWEPPEVQDDAQAAEAALLDALLFQDPGRTLKDGSAAGLPLAVVQKRLAAWLRMVTGWDFAGIGHSELPTTDGTWLYLPQAAPPEGDPARDERLLRVMALIQAGLWTHGLLDDPALLRALYRDWVLRTTWLGLAARWVLDDAARRYPGLAGDLTAVHADDRAGQLYVNVSPLPRDGLPAAFQPLVSSLTLCLQWRATGRDTVPATQALEAVRAVQDPLAARLVLAGQARRLRQHFGALGLGPPPLPAYVGVVRPEWILADLEHDQGAIDAWKEGPSPLRGLRKRLSKRLRRGRKPTPDVGKMPAYGVLRDEAQAAARRSDAPKTATRDRGDDGRLVDEWDAERNGWRLGEVRVIEQPSPAGPLATYERLAQAHAAEIAQVRRRFAALRVEERWLGGQPEGPELDMDRVLTALTDLAAGQQPKEDLHRRFVRQRRPLCVSVLVDLSGSTQGRVLAAQQEALVIFCEGLRALGLPHLIQGFEGNPGVVHLWSLKDWEQPYDDVVFKRIAGLRAQGASRMGAVVRHATHQLSLRREPLRLLLLLSDGKPEDRGHYRGDYGVADTAMAVQQAHRQGVRVHCVSLDGQDADWLGRIYGSRYTLIGRVEELPERLPDLFRGLIG
jgi:uncharacterized protein YegL